MTDKTPLKPPDGYKTWIDYAIATMDVRTPHLESCDTDTVILSDDFRQAARDERDELVSALEGTLEACLSEDGWDSEGYRDGKATLDRAKGETT